MKIGIKHITFVLLGVFIATAIFVVTKLNTASAEKKHGKKFNDWTVSCSSPQNDQAKTEEICMLSQQINLTEDGKEKPIAFFQFIFLGPKKELKLIQILPLGVAIEAGTSIVSSKNLIAPGKYTTCLADGCRAVSSISEENLKTILSNVDNGLAFINLEGKQILFPLSINGLKEGLEYIKP